MAVHLKALHLLASAQKIVTNLFPPLVFSAFILAVAEEYCNGLGTSCFVGELLLLKFNFLSSWTKGITILQTLVGWDIKPQRCVHLIMHSVGFFSSSDNPRSDSEKTQPSAIASGNSPSGVKIKTGINVFVAYIPDLLWKGLELISYPFQKKGFPLILTPEIFHYLGINAAWRSMGPAQEKTKQEQKHLLIFLKLN